MLLIGAGAIAAACASAASGRDVSGDFLTTPHTVELPIEAPTLDAVLPYSAGVTKGGHAYARIDINTWPIFHRFPAAVSIRYLGNRIQSTDLWQLPRDTLGYGWRVAGFPTVRWCKKHTGDEGPLRLDGTEGICLSGEPLVLTAGEHLRPMARYRPLRDDFTVVEIKGGPALSDIWFEAVTSQGLIYEYGRIPTSRVRFTTFDGAVDGAGGGGDAFGEREIPRTWFVNKITDRTGYSLRYEYHAFPEDGVVVPKRIVHGDDESAELRFKYTRRKDVGTVAVAGSHQLQRWRLHRIDLLALREKVLDVRLESTPTSRGFEMLKRLQSCHFQYSRLAGCSTPITMRWRKPPSSVPYPRMLLRSIDSSHIRTAFEYDLYKAGHAHRFELSAGDHPFGKPMRPSNARESPSAESVSTRVVVTEVTRLQDKQASSVRYAYFGPGWYSTRKWGLLGFYATRESDTTAGTVTYRQYRLDFPHFGKQSALIQYDSKYGPEAVTLKKQFTLHDAIVISHGSAVTHYPYVRQQTEFFSESGIASEVGQIGEVPAVSADGVSKRVMTHSLAGSASANHSTAIWGATEFDLSDVYHQVTNEFDAQGNPIDR